MILDKVYRKRRSFEEKHKTLVMWMVAMFSEDDLNVEDVVEYRPEEVEPIKKSLTIRILAIHMFEPFSYCLCVF
jgi:hypothetical protein